MVSEPFPAMAPETRRWDSLSAMAAPLQLSLLCTASMIAMMCSHTVTTIAGLHDSFTPPTFALMPSPTPQNLQDRLLFPYTARLTLIFSHLGFLELATAAPSHSDSTCSTAVSSAFRASSLFGSSNSSVADSNTPMLLRPFSAGSAQSDVATFKFIFLCSKIHLSWIPKDMTLPRVVAKFKVRHDADSGATSDDIVPSVPQERRIIIANQLPIRSFRNNEAKKWSFELDSDSFSTGPSMILAPGHCLTSTSDWINRKSITAARLVTAGHTRLVVHSSRPKIGRPLPRLLVLLAVSGTIPNASSDDASFHGDYSKLFGTIIHGFASTQLRAWSILDCPVSPTPSPSTLTPAPAIAQPFGSYSTVPSPPLIAQQFGKQVAMDCFLEGHDQINTCLSHEIIIEIFRRLDSKSSRDACSLVCKRWLRLERLSRATIQIGATSSPDLFANPLARLFSNVKNIHIDDCLSSSLPIQLRRSGTTDNSTVSSLKLRCLTGKSGTGDSDADSICPSNAGLDTDELIHPAGTQQYSLLRLLSDVPRNVDMVIFPNYKGSVERDEIKEPFSEVSMFKKNHDHLPKDVYFGNYKEATRSNLKHFLTYGNGKAAVRIQDHLRPNGAHRWHNYMKKPREKLDEAAVLHYTYPKFSDLTSRRDCCGCKLETFEEGHLGLGLCSHSYHPKLEVIWHL